MCEKPEVKMSSKKETSSPLSGVVFSDVDNVVLRKLKIVLLDGFEDNSSPTSPASILRALSFFMKEVSMEKPLLKQHYRAGDPSDDFDTFMVVFYPELTLSKRFMTHSDSPK